MKLFGLILIQRVLMCASKKVSEGVEVTHEHRNGTLVLAPQDNTNYEYLYKSNSPSANYLNYRAVYGLRYTPTKQPVKLNLETQNIYTTEPSFTTDKVNSASENVNETESIDEYVATTVESEIVASNETSASETFPQQDFTFASFEPVVDESRNHIMRPNDRVEYALKFLAERLKKLLYYSMDPKRPESKFSPQLTSLGRFMKLFSLIKFENVPCITASKPLRQLSGTCYNEVECVSLGGIAVNSCASGFGVCCVFKGSCGSVSLQNVTYFESPNFPYASENDLNSCTLTILLSRDVQQVRVDFLFFELLPPTDGNCLDDKMSVSGQAYNFDVPIICGVATGQHMYIDVEQSEKLQFNVETRTASSRAFSIKVTQLRDYLAPQGCLQWHTGSEGIIQTFNYDEFTQIQMIRNPSYFNNLNYAICIRRTAGFCQITYANEIGGRENIFEIINVDEGGNIIPGPGQAGAEVFSCQDDFIGVNYIRLCGSKLNDGSVTGNFNLNIPVQSYMNGPIIIPVKTNNNTVGRGFKIYYFQDKCNGYSGQFK